MIHGFGGGGAIFVKMFPYLRHYFTIVCIDMLGMGSSGRPEYDSYTFDSAVEFHLDSIRAWMDRKLVDQKYYLLGHSLGGCIACHYALKYPKNIEKLILMSPVGIMETPEHLQRERVHQRLETCL